MRIPTHNSSPNSLASIGPKLKTTPRHLLFSTTTVGTHRGAGSGACWIKFGRDLLHQPRRVPRAGFRGSALDDCAALSPSPVRPGGLTSTWPPRAHSFVTGAVPAPGDCGVRAVSPAQPGGSTSTLSPLSGPVSTASVRVRRALHACTPASSSRLRKERASRVRDMSTTEGCGVCRTMKDVVSLPIKVEK